MPINIINRLDTREAQIGILGLGYVGLPLLLRYAEVGYNVLGLDIDPDKVDQLNAGQSDIEHISAARIQAAFTGASQPSTPTASGTPSPAPGSAPCCCEATTDFSRARECDALILCVPTPLNKYREPDLSDVLDTTEAIVPHLRPGQVVSLESTTWPGTTDEALKPRLERSGLRIGQDLFLVFSPEREDPGNPHYSTRTIPKVLGGLTPACTRVGQALYGQVIDQVVTLSSTRAAEMTKLLENIHRAVNIGLVNELKIVCDRLGLDIHEVIRAAATKPFGFGVEENVDDRRESRSIELMELLQAKGAEISYSDPHVPKFLRMRKHDFDLESVPLTPETLAATDCVLLATDHDRFDYDLIKRHAPLIVDTRGRYQEPAGNIVKA